MTNFLFLWLADYWNSKYRQTCPITDDSRGITLQSLGGIFLATLVGLLLSMITLAYEVWQQKKKEREQNKVIPRFESNIILQLFNYNTFFCLSCWKIRNILSSWLRHKKVIDISTQDNGNAPPEGVRASEGSTSSKDREGHRVMQVRCLKHIFDCIHHCATLVPLIK